MNREREQRLQSEFLLVNNKDMNMNKALKRIVMAIGIITLLAVIWGCRSDGASQKKVKENDTADDFYVYYINDGWKDISRKKIDIDQMASAENKVDFAMNALLEGSDTADLSAPVPNGMIYQRYIYDGFGTVNLIFNADMEAVDTYSVVLSKMAFVKTLSQIDSVQKIVYEVVDSVNEENVITEELTTESFADMDNIMDSEKEIRIYMPDSSGKSLVEKSLILDYSAKESLPEQVIQGLGNEYDGTATPFNEKTVVKNISIDKGLCTVTFNDAFVNGKDGIDDNVIVYSIVDSLLELDDVKKVQLISDNTGNRLNAIDLEKQFTGDYSYVTR